MFKPTPRVRTLPFDLSKKLAEYGDAKTLLARMSQMMPGGVAWGLSSLGSSFFIEYVEQQIYFLHEKYGAFDGGNKGSDDFIKQELMHSGYHRCLNKIFEPNYVKTEFGPPRVNSLIHPHLAAAELDYRKLALGSEQEKAEALMRMEFKAAAFETGFGVFNALSNCQLIEAHFNEIVDVCPPLLYLWAYHFAEELEHIHLPLLAFEEKYQAVSPDQASHFAMEIEWLVNLWRGIGIHLGLRYGIQIEYKDFLEEPTVLGMRRLQQEVGNDFKRDKISEMRKHYVELFDKKWEPLLLKAVQA